MKLLIGAAASIIAVTAASAADLSRPVYSKAPTLAAPVFSWAGWYAGINGGYSWRDPSIDFTPGNAVTAAAAALAPGVFPPSVAVDPKGGLFGGQIGYNWQSASWVWGLETDLDWADIKSSGSAAGVEFPAVRSRFDATGTQAINAFGTLRARLGVAPTDHLLIYATGGLAYGHAKLNTTYGNQSFNFSASNSTDKWKAGWTVGAGIEWAFLNNWSLRGEYLYYDIGSIDQPLADLAGTSPTALFNAHADYRGNIVRAAVNYKFP